MKKQMIHSIVLVFAILFLNKPYPTLAQDNDVPPLNQKIIDYVNSVIGKKVDRGECWDLANQALTRINAKWDHQYVYGKKIDTKREQVYPGDIIQFKNVKISYREGNTIRFEEMKHHTAIVYKVIEPGVYELAHQNTGFSGRKVGISKLDVSTVRKGTMKFYRPVK
jgi:hypothetical protein